MSGIEKREDPLIQEAIRILNEEYEDSKDFNRCFDINEPFRIGNLEFPKSKVLFWLDREAFYEEQQNLLNRSLQEKHMSCTGLIKDQGLGIPFAELIASVKRGRVVPYIGAGMSNPMGMPLWGDALKELLSQLPGADVHSITAHIEACDYLKAAQLMINCDEVLVTNFIRTKYRIQKIKPAGPMMLLPRIAKGCIITTNFDDAIEKIFERENVIFDAYMHGTQEHSFFPRLVRGDRCLLKLHGDADSPGTHILTERQYANGYGDPFDFHKPLPKALRQVFVSQSILFLGCSLEKDRALELLEKAKEGGDYAIPNHFAILPEPQGVKAKQQKASRLLKLNIQPLWYPPDQHEFVERYLPTLTVKSVFS